MNKQKEYQIVHYKNGFEEYFYLKCKKRFLFFTWWETVVEKDGVGNFYGWMEKFSCKEKAEEYIKKLLIEKTTTIV